MGKQKVITERQIIITEKHLILPDPENQAKLEANQKHYSEKKLWKKVKRWAKRAGKSVIQHALVLYYTAKDPDTPQHIRVLIYGALGYFILPIDLIPDMLFGAGFVDDLAILAVLLIQIAEYVKPEHYQQASERLKEWFGEDEDSPEEEPQPA